LPKCWKIDRLGDFIQTENRKGDMTVDPIHDIELEDCPVCRGPGCLQEEQDWCFYTACLDCGSHTAEIRYHTPEERLPAARQAARLWNMGKVIRAGVGD